MPDPATFAAFPKVPLPDAAAARSTVGGLLAVVGCLLGGCAGVPPVGAPGNALTTPTAADAIAWPEAYKPELATFTITNSVLISAPPEAVWDQLIHAESWPNWYSGATNVVVEGSTGGKLQEGSTINWTTMDQDLVTKVVEFVPPYRMGWESRQSTLKAYHAWLLIPTAEGTRVVTDESQFGLLAHLQRIFLPNKLRKLHDEWLAVLKQRAEAASLGGGADASEVN
ncbi:MAG: SRPBCC domain-containing protein [Planctomyces sp.]|nr:SRPBCC domain-containing protein [Planctomyces sp.]MBA4120581.1 SRPBCC domain-containing protein [Isosphaera sp.]